MYNIALLCQWGASTAMVAEKIVEAGKEKGVEVVANAYAVTEIEKVMDSADVILFGPQVRFIMNTLEKKYSQKEVPFVTIDPKDYGRMDGEKILNLALAAIENK